MNSAAEAGTWIKAAVQAEIDRQKVSTDEIARRLQQPVHIVQIALAQPTMSVATASLLAQTLKCRLVVTRGELYMLEPIQ